jgi:hypothetical protein
MCSEVVEFRDGMITFAMHDDKTDRSRVSTAAGSGAQGSQPWTLLRWTIKASGLMGEWLWAPQW